MLEHPPETFGSSFFASFLDTILYCLDSFNIQPKHRHEGSFVIYASFLEGLVDLNGWHP
jgi:hypothetical protein